MWVWILFPLGCLAAFTAGVLVAAILSAAGQADARAAVFHAVRVADEAHRHGNGGVDAHPGV